MDLPDSSEVLLKPAEVAALFSVDPKPAPFSPEEMADAQSTANGATRGTR